MQQVLIQYAPKAAAVQWAIIKFNAVSTDIQYAPKAAAVQWAIIKFNAASTDIVRT